MDTLERLSALQGRLQELPLPRAEREWGGADVVVATEAPAPMAGGFYPDPRFVVTPHALEVSWVFMQLYEIFASSELIDCCSKIEFIGRLANAADALLKQTPDADASALCAAVLYEARVIYDEMHRGVFGYFEVATGGIICDDLTRRTE